MLVRYHTYILSLVAAPYWTNGPVSQLYAPGETVKLDCQADGIPSPTISWTMNGIPLSGRYTDPPAAHILEHGACIDRVVFFFLTATDEEPRRALTASGSLILMDVNFGDTAIYQCQASNKHGSILTNTNVYVIGESLFCICHLFNRVLCVCTRLCVCVCVSHFSLCVCCFRAASSDPY